MSNTYTVSQINRYIKNIMDNDYLLKRITVKGEISNIKYHSSGHIYFSLKDSSASIACMMFADKRAAGLKFQARDGDKVEVTGSVGVYEAAGRYQLYAVNIAKEGLGELYIRFEELKKKLSEMGMFDESYKREIPPYAMKIGIVTSRTGAAIKDIYQVSRRRNPYVELYLYDALVQGETAKYSIARGIEVMDEKGFDVLIVGRGGGSIEDLWAFNEEEVAYAIFNAKTPIISAVGHEINFTIADFVADMRAATPSAAAELATFDYYKLQDEMEGYAQGMKSLLENSIRDKSIYLMNCEDRLKNNINNRAENLSESLKLKEKQLNSLHPEKILESSMEKTRTDRERLTTAMLHRLNDRILQLNNYEGILNTKMELALQREKSRLQIYNEKFEGLSIKKRLDQGYALVRSSSKSIKSVKDVKKDDRLEIMLSDGTLETVVDKISKL